MSSLRHGTWSNWAGNQKATPEWINEPAGEPDVADIVKRAHARQEKVKAVGSGHSFTGTALTNGHLIDMSHLDKMLHVDRENLRVTVQAGMQISDLNQQLFELGLAMANMGDIAYQTISGAISTSTHGTGARLTGIAGQVAALRLVSGNGDVIEISPTSNSDLLDFARVGVGSLGIVTEVTLDVVPSFRLEAVEGAQRLDALLENLDELTARNDHFEFFWIPHTKWALTKQNNRSEKPLDVPSRLKHWYSKSFLENYAFGAVCALGRARPSLIPRLSTALPSSGQTTIVDESFRIFASKRIVKFVEMEYAIPIENCGEALQRIRRMIDDKGHKISFPVEVRFTNSDNIALSTASNRETAYIAVHMYKGMPFESYFRDVADIMADYQGRPHWGKMHYLAAEQLAGLYPRFEEFLQVRDRLDPDRTFANEYTKQVFGD